MNEAHRGLAFHPRTPEFLSRVYGVAWQGLERAMPLYRDARGRFFWGGWGSFYTVCIEEPSAEILRAASTVGRAHGAIEACVSISDLSIHSRHVNPMLTLPEKIQPEERFELYERNIKKHIRNTVAGGSVRYEVGSLPDRWQALHATVMSSRGRASHDPSYFSTLADCFGADLITIVARENGTLVGGLVCLRHGDYLHLLSIAVDAAYRSARVDSGLYDHAILFSIEHGIRFVDFGLTDARNESLIAHKRGFGAIPRQVLDRRFGTLWGRFGVFASRSVRTLQRCFWK